mgnify:CR=1 FL=1
MPTEEKTSCCSCAHSGWTHDYQPCGWVRHIQSRCFQLGMLVSWRMPEQWWREVSAGDGRRTSSSPAWESRIGKGKQLLKKTAAFFAKEINRFIRQNSKITYTAKGTPKLVLSSDLNTNAYILHDRDSSNGKCMHTNIPAEMYCGRSPCVEWCGRRWVTECGCLWHILAIVSSDTLSR